MREFLSGRTGNPKTEELKKYIYAHRGFHDKPVIPENSMKAFCRAAERGWGIELDVHLTKDHKLAVFHDSDLRRITGAEGVLEDKTWEELSVLRLEGTSELIPLFDEVLAVTENRSPLIIELKTKNNRKELVRAVCDRLDSYRGLYCIESFDPLAMGEVRKYRPDIVRGQLACNFFRDDEPIPGWQKFLLTNMLTNVFSRPDFIAYKFEDRNQSALHRMLGKGLTDVAWTIRDPADLRTCIEKGIVPIFEKFDPEP